jgi:predicted DNA-binding protein YlxM (UPF0122 family)
MREIHTLERYEIRGNSVYDKTKRRPATLDEIRAALEFWATAKVVLDEVVRKNGGPF